ncbi:MAG: hypothetical protein ACLQIB_15245 [Isosphaeraceae bacterium]
MPGLFDRTDDIVRQAFIDHGIEAKGKDFTTDDHHIRFSRFVLDNPDDAQQLICDIMLRTYCHLRTRLEDKKTRESSRCGGRGMLRQEIELSRKRLIATFEDGEDWEVTIERAIVFCKQKRPCPVYDWFNQLNVASGICGGRSDKKTAIDLIRQNRQDPSLLDMIELKIWDSSDHRLHAAYELFRYFCAVLILGKQGRDPNCPAGRWAQFSHARLFVLAPEDWYAKHRRHRDPDLTMEAFGSAFSVISHEIEDFRCAEFHNRGLRLRSLSKDEFVSLFEKKQEGQPDYAMSNLGDQEIELLTNWIDEAFRPADQRT